MADRLTTVLKLVCCGLAAHAAWYLVIGIDKPLGDLFAFRQTQTALTAWWLWQGGPWLAYETPVLGAPWSVPFELPVVQAITAILRGLAVPIDAGGRLVSFAFFLGSLFPLRLLLMATGHSRLTFWTVSALYLASPIYVYWASTVMIESCALFLGLLWLAMVARFVEHRDPWSLIAGVVAGCLMMTIKASVFPALGLLGGLITLGSAYRA